MAKSAIHFKAYGTTIRVHKWTKEMRQQAPPRQGGGGGSESFSNTDAAGVHTVNVSGFEKMSAADIMQNEAVLLERLENRGRYHAGPVERLEVKQPRRATAKPFAIATFSSATGEPRSQVLT